MGCSRTILGALVGLALCPAVAAAQEPNVFTQVRFAGGREVHVETAWAGVEPGSGGRVTLRVPGERTERPIHAGGRAASAVATRGATVLVAVTELRPRADLRLALFDLDRGPRAEPVELRAPLPDGPGFIPSAVVACEDADGFTVLWQAISARGTREGRTWMARVSADGRWVRRPAAVAVPWAIGAVAWNGAGYHLALFFDGASPGQTRLCLVTLTPEGQPEQHPWWASRPGLVDEVQLVAAGGRIVAAYRAGPDGAELRSRDVTVPGQWGREVESPRAHGPVAADEEFVLVAQGGEPHLVRRTAADLSR